MIFSKDKAWTLMIGVVICSNIVTSQGLRILGLFPLHMKSHDVMCEELMRGLAARGHEVHVHGHFPPKSQIPNFKYFKFEGELETLSNNVSLKQSQKSSISALIEHWMVKHGHPICNLMSYPLLQELINNPPKDRPYDLVITEISVGYCYIPFGRHLNVPVIGVATLPLTDMMYESFTTPYNLAVDPSFFSRYHPPMTFFQRLNNVITFHYALNVFKTYVTTQDRLVEKYFGPNYPSVLDLTKEISLVLVNHDPVLSGLRPFAPKVVPVGGLHLADRNETLPSVVQKWLDESVHGCVYFAFGSMARVETFPKQVLDDFYKSFENISPVRVLWKVAKPEELPIGLPANVMIQPWFQQAQVLKHKRVKAFVTHGGLMSTQESIHYGVPMVGVPLFSDQYFNVDSYVKKGIAIKVNLEKITEQSFTNALNEILKNPSYKETVLKISQQSKDRPMSPMDTAHFWIEYIHRHGKDALKSPIDDLPWWQASLLDVYGLIVMSIVIIMYLTVKILNKFIKLFTTKSQKYSKMKRN